MSAQTHLIQTQPQTHATNTKMCLQVFLCEDYSLTSQEIQAFYDLKTQANVLFEQQERWDLIKSLYTQYFGTPAQVSGKEWMRLGFQGQYPQTDFRGGGVLSLQLILRFVRRNRQLVERMQKDSAGFFFAITAINIAFFMKKYFHLADFLVAGKDVDVYCNRKAFKNFCRVLTSNTEAYSDIHEALLKYFYNRIWTHNEQALLQFNSLFEQLTSRVKDCFQQNNLQNLQQFKEIYQA